MAKTPVTINGINARNLGATLVDYKIYACSYDDNYFLPDKSIMPVALKTQVGLRKIVLTFDMIGPSDYGITVAISNLTVLLMSGTEIRLPDDFLYTCVYSKAGEPEVKAPWIKRVKYELYGYRHSDLKSVVVTDGMKLEVSDPDITFTYGDVMKVPVRYIIEPGTDTVVSVNGITVKNVTSTVIIDGFTSKVTMDGINKFGDTDIVEFPKLQVGENLMHITGDATVTAEYYIIYV